MKPDNSTSVKRLFLYFISWLSGFSVMGLEMSLSRQVAPYFGSSMLIWAILISFVLVTMAFGYSLGGKLSTGRATLKQTGLSLIVAGAGIGLTGLLGPLLFSCVAGVAKTDSIIVGLAALVIVIVLVSISLVSLCMVIPIIVRIGVTSLENSGQTAGRIHSFATVGSLMGTLLSSFVFLPALGTTTTFAVLGLATFLAGIFFVEAKLTSKVILMAIALCLGVSLARIGHVATELTSGSSEDVIYRGETFYHHAFVLERKDGLRKLKLDAGWSTQSVYHPNGPSKGGSWPMFLLAQEVKNDCEKPPRSALVVGLAAGTLARDLEFAYPKIAIDGVEIDRALVEIGVEYFELPGQTRVVFEDGRTFLAHSKKTYDYIFLDAYNGMYVPPHLVTKEFFSLAKSRLESGGVIAANLLTWKNEEALAQAVAQTIETVFENVRIVRKPGLMNVLLLAWDGDHISKKKNRICAKPKHPFQKKFVEFYRNKISEIPNDSNLPVFTDDKAPVEYFTHKIVQNVLWQGEFFDFLKKHGWNRS